MLSQVSSHMHSQVPSQAPSPHSHLEHQVIRQQLALVHHLLHLRQGEHDKGGRSTARGQVHSTARWQVLDRRRLSPTAPLSQPGPRQGPTAGSDGLLSFGGWGRLRAPPLLLFYCQVEQGKKY